MPPPDPPDDPVLDAELARALDPYRALLSPELFAELEETLADALTTHPVGSRLLDRLRPPPALVASGEVEKDGQAPSDADEVEGKNGAA